jgi:glucosamine-phosphate N-acetyltransferase
MTFRILEYNDYNKNYFDLLKQLTIANPCTEIKFNEFVNKLNENHVILVCEVNNKIIASGTLLIEQKLIRDCGKVGHIEDIVVDKEYKNNGLGKKLVVELTTYAKKNGCYKVILDCRKEIIPFYEKCGYKNHDDHMVQYF